MTSVSKSIAEPQAELRCDRRLGGVGCLSYMLSSSGASSTTKQLECAQKEANWHFYLNNSLSDWHPFSCLTKATAKGMHCPIFFSAEQYIVLQSVQGDRDIIKSSILELQVDLNLNSTMKYLLPWCIF